MTIAGDLDVILHRNGVPKSSTQSCINDIFYFLMSGDTVSFLLNEEIDITEFYAGIKILKDKVIWTNKSGDGK
jgi:hypothetical protein